MTLFFLPYSKMLLCWRNEPFTSSYLFSFQGKIYTIEPLEFEPDDECHIILQTIHPYNALSVTVKVQIQYTNRCNLMCPGCYVSSGVPLATEMSDDEIISLLGKLRDWGVLQIEWSGGEFFSRKSFIEMLQTAQSFGFEQNVLSNGIALGRIDGLAEEIWNYCYAVQLSVDCTGMKFNEWVHNNRGWESLTNALGKLKGSKPPHDRIDIATVLHPSTSGELPLIAQSIDGIADVWRLARQVRNGRSNLSEHAADEVLFQSFDVISKLRTKYAYTIVHPFDKEDHVADMWPIDWLSEPGSHTALYVNASGDAYVFPYFDSITEFFGGNVLQNSLEDIWWSDSFQSFRSISRVKTGCGECNKVCRMWSRSFNYFMERNLQQRPLLHPGCSNMVTKEVKS